MHTIITATLCAAGLIASQPEDLVPAAVPTAVNQWLAANALPLDTVDPTLALDDLEGLRGIVGDARVVLIGEPTHGNREIYQLKHRMVRYLVEELGFNVFAFETPMADSFGVDRFVSGGQGTAETALAATQVWPWDTESVADMLRWMRAFNADPARPHHLTFHGFDMQSPEAAARGTLAYLDRVAPELAAEARAAFGHVAIPISDPDAVGYRPIVERDFDAAVQDAVARVIATFDAQREAWQAATDDDAWLVARHHTRLLQQWVDSAQDGGADYDRVRDAAMAENVRWILERHGPETRVVLWAHNSHVANAKAPESWGFFRFLGHHLRETMGDDLRIIGAFFGRGTFTAMEVGTSSRSLWPFSAGPPETGSLESAFEAAELDLALVDFDRLPADGPVADWFAAPQQTRHSGGTYDLTNPGRYRYSYTLPEAFDAIVYVDATTPTRLVEPADHVVLPILTKPINAGFEHGRLGEAPAGWFAWSKQERFGFVVETTAVRPFHGTRAATVRRTPGDHLGEASGSVLQRIDATPFRGRRVRLRAAVRAELAGGGPAFLRLRIQPPAFIDHETQADLFDSLDEHRITSPEWTMREIIADVPADAAVISYGLFLSGDGAAWIDAVSVEAID